MTVRLLIFCILYFVNFLTYSQGQLKSLTKSDSLLNLIKQGSDNVEVIGELYRINEELSIDSINRLMVISNENFKEQFKNEKMNFNLELQLREFFLSDQLYRIKCNYHKTKSVRDVQINDSLLQIKFSNLYNDSISTKLLLSKTFNILLLHSAATINTGFFEKYFHRYSSIHDNDFTFKNLKLFMDAYLKYKYNKQYFETGFGYSELPDKSYGLLEKLSESEFRLILNELKVNDAKL